MLQKRTTYHNQLQTLPVDVKFSIKDFLRPDERQKVAYLVFLDMLQLLKM